MPEISILIAIYNAEHYLEKCLKSLQNQTFKNFQAICVDDCSTDKSFSIIEKYAKKDNRFCVIKNNKNLGIAGARNVGIKYIEGKYTGFLDADDWLSDNALQEIINTFSKRETIDSVLLRCVNVYESEGNIVNEEFGGCKFDSISGTKAFELSVNWDIHGIYFTKTNIQKQFIYDDSAMFYSDENTTRIHYLKSREVAWCNGIYYYLQHSQSSSHIINIRKFDTLIAKQNLKKLLIENNAPQKIIDDYETILWLNIIDMYFYYYSNKKIFTKEEKKYSLMQIKSAIEKIKTNKIDTKIKRKFGYIPISFSWKLFRLQEELYFFLRKLQ